ncbi:UNVERIFIED_CONTAM: hypothetical protein K2H54_024568 [Gekko kuhli]
MGGGKMLGWIEKVVPQPPVIPPTPKVVEKTAKPESKGKESKSGRSRKNRLLPAINLYVCICVYKNGNVGSGQRYSNKEQQHMGVEIRAGMVEDLTTHYAFPRYVPSSGRGVLTWLSDGLEKVVPQPLPPSCLLQQNSKTSDAANQTEAQKAEDDGKQGKTFVPVCFLRACARVCVCLGMLPQEQNS